VCRAVVTHAVHVRLSAVKKSVSDGVMRAHAPQLQQSALQQSEITPPLWQQPPATTALAPPTASLRRDAAQSVTANNGVVPLHAL
jgi:hypothetical protein